MKQDAQETRERLGRLYQARMWREYAQTFDGKRTATGITREWVEGIMHMTRADCLRHAREALS